MQRRIFRSDGESGGEGAGAGGGDGTVEATKPFMAQLRGDYKTDPRVAEYDGFNEIVDDLLRTKETTSSMLRVPGEEATPEERAAFNRAIGVPETTADYEFNVPKDAEGAAKLAEEVAFLAHESGVPKQAAQKLFDYLIKATTDTRAAFTEAKETRKKETFDALRNEWKNEYPAKVAQMDKGIDWIGGESDKDRADFRKEIEDTGIGNHPGFVKAMVALGRALQEDPLIGSPGRARVEQRKGVFQYKNMDHLINS
jgi:hypothetical protein